MDSSGHTLDLEKWFMGLDCLERIRPGWLQWQKAKNGEAHVRKPIDGTCKQPTHE